MRAVIVGSGSEIPGQAVTNQMLSRIMDTSDEWIRERTGIEQRHIADDGELTSDLGIAASRKALAEWASMSSSLWKARRTFRFRPIT